jgi:hypothetical protein
MSQANMEIAERRPDSTGLGRRVASTFSLQIGRIWL